MREIRHHISSWFDSGLDVTLAQVTKTWGSSPRMPGSLMAVNERGSIAGSVSGGCIEGGVIQVALDCLRGRGGASLEKFHASTTRAREVGLSCGGNIEILIARYTQSLFEAECAELDEDRSYVRVSLVEASEEANVGASFLLVSADATMAEGCVGLRSYKIPDHALWRMLLPTPLEEGLSCDLLIEVARDVLSQSTTEISGHIKKGSVGNDFFYVRTNPQPTLVCVGGVHIAIHLTQMAKALGYRTVVVDPRGVFSTNERFPFVDNLIHLWPQEAFKTLRLNESTALCALTHDPKIDLPALGAALDSQAFYIGSLGRHTTQLSRYRQLVCEGYTDESIARIYGPIGLDLKGREPSEIALSIMAEITAVRHGGCFPMSTMLASAQLVEESSKE